MRPGGSALGVAAFLLILAGASPSPTEAQRGWFPDGEPFERLIASPREVAFRGSFVVADRAREPGFGDRTIEAEVVLGQRLGLYRFDGHAGMDGAFSVHFEFGIFTRFYMEERSRDLVNADFRVGLPLEYSRGALQLRVGYRHLSSHIGDDFFVRFTPDTLYQTSKDGLEGLVALDLTDALRVYGGADYNFHHNLNMSRYALRGGVELEPARGDRGRVWGFLAVDTEYFSYSEDVGVTATAGIGFMVRDRLIRMEARGHTGPTFMAQFRETDEEFVGIGLRVEL